MDFQGAKREVEKALELDEKYVKAWARKGDIEFLQKEYHKAMDSYQKGLNLEPGNKLCSDGLNKTYQMVNSNAVGVYRFIYIYMFSSLYFGSSFLFKLCCLYIIQKYNCE